MDFDHLWGFRKIFFGEDFDWLLKYQAVLPNPKDSPLYTSKVEEGTTPVRAKTREEAEEKARNEIYKKFNGRKISNVSFSSIEPINRRMDKDA